MTLGELYRAIFPDGAISAFNERVLKQLGVTTISLPSSGKANYQEASHIYDSVLEEEANRGSSLRDKPITSNYVKDEPKKDQTDRMEEDNLKALPITYTNEETMSNSSDISYTTEPEGTQIDTSTDTITDSVSEKQLNKAIISIPTLSTMQNYTESPASNVDKILKSSPSPISTKTTSSPQPLPIQVTAKTSQLPINTIFAEEETDETPRVIRSANLTSVQPPTGKPASLPTSSTPLPVIRPRPVGFDSNDAGAKLREWIKTYFSV